MYDLLIKNGKVVTADAVTEGNVAVKDGKIAAVLEAGIEPEAGKVIDAKGKYVFPGAIDTHAHLNDPGYEWREDYEHGTAAAALGGYTTVIDMPLQNEPCMTNAETFDFKENKVSPNAYVDYCFWGGLTSYNFGDLKDLDEKGCVSFKSFIGPVSPDYESLSYGQALEAMDIIKEFDGRAGFHCEDYSIIKNQEKRMKEAGRNDWKAYLESRPVVAEIVATDAIIEIAKATGCKAHICHVSHPAVAKKIKAAQDEGYDITAETCTHYLTLTTDCLDKPGFEGAKYICSTPLRPQEHVEALWQAVREGWLTAVGSDHCALDGGYEGAKKKGTNFSNIPNGCPGVQDRLALLWTYGVCTGKITRRKFVELFAANPAKVVGLPNKGDLRIGADADVVIFDPEWKGIITNKDSLHGIDYEPFEGFEIQGRPQQVFLRGRLVAENGRFVGERGMGRWQKCKPYGLCYDYYHK